MMTKGGEELRKMESFLDCLWGDLFHILGETIGGERLHIATLCLMEVA